jgi:hypothetical protein
MRKTVIASKQVGYIYHLTNTESDYRILREDTLGRTIGSAKAEYVSFTRNPKYNAISGKWDDTPSLKFVVDGNKLSTRYKIRPHADIKSGFGGRFEQEEVVKGPIKDLSKYLVGIQVLNGFKELRALRLYLDKHPHVKIFGKLAPSFLKPRLKEVEGYWYEGKHVPDIGQLLKTHKDFSDWEPIDIGYIISRDRPEDDLILAHPSMLYVDVEEYQANLFLNIIYNPVDESKLKPFVKKLSEITSLPEMKITQHKAVSEYPEHYEDEDED